MTSLSKVQIVALGEVGLLLGHFSGFTDWVGLVIVTMAHVIVQDSAFTSLAAMCIFVVIFICLTNEFHHLRCDLVERKLHRLFVNHYWWASVAKCVANLLSPAILQCLLLWRSTIEVKGRLITFPIFLLRVCQHSISIDCWGGLVRVIGQLFLALVNFLNSLQLLVNQDRPTIRRLMWWAGGQ